MKKSIKAALTWLGLAACCPFCFPCYLWIVRGTRKRARRRREGDSLYRTILPNEYMVYDGNDVRPLPSKRRRLSITSDDKFTKGEEVMDARTFLLEKTVTPDPGVGMGHERANSYEDERRVFAQDQSPFFSKLPPELREMIYKEVLGGYHIRLAVSPADKRLLHLKRRGRFMQIHPYPESHEREPFLSMLQACRRVYTEATPLLYSQNIFSFHSSMPLLSLTSSIRLNRFNSITSININWTVPIMDPTDFPFLFQQALIHPTDENSKLQYHRALCRQTCLVVQSMKGLKRLEVLLWPFQFVGTLKDELRMMLECLKIITRPSVFVVAVGFREPVESSEDYEMLQLGDVGKRPYKLRWLGSFNHRSRPI